MNLTLGAIPLLFWRTLQMVCVCIWVSVNLTLSEYVGSVTKIFQKVKQYLRDYTNTEFKIFEWDWEIIFWKEKCIILFFSKEVKFALRVCCFFGLSLFLLSFRALGCHCTNILHRIYAYYFFLFYMVAWSAMELFIVENCLKNFHLPLFENK